jgi:hypothetical protein
MRLESATRHGSPIGKHSIWNVICKYGSVISDFSAYDRIAQQPPVLVDATGAVVAYVSVNGAKFPRVSPKRLRRS